MQMTPLCCKRCTRQRKEEILYLLPPVGLEVFHLQPDEPACSLVVGHPDAGLQEEGHHG